MDCNRITDIVPLKIDKRENNCDIRTNSFKHFDLYILLQQEIDRGIFTRWFHLFSIFFSCYYHPGLRVPSSSLSSSLYRCVCSCVRRTYTEPTSSRLFEGGKKRAPLAFAHLRCLSSSVVIKGKGSRGVVEGAKLKGRKESEGERAEVTGQGTQSSGIKPSRLLPTSREFSPFSASNPRPLPPRISLRWKDGRR